MAEVDTSSYPKPAMPVSPLDIASKLGGLQSQALSINQQKLDQANQGLTYMTRAMGALGPNASKEQYISAAQTAVQMGLVPAQALDTFKQRAMAAPDSQSFYNEFMTTAANHQQQIDYHLGKPGSVETGQTVTPTQTSVKPGFGVRPVGMPIQMQAPPTMQSADETGRQRALGAQPPQLAPGSVAGPTPLPASRPAPAIPGPVTSPAIQGQSSNFGGNVLSANVEPPIFNQRYDAAFPKPQGAATGLPPNFEAGKAMHNKDLEIATGKATALKPLEEAYDLAKSVATGPGTESLNKARAYLFNAGLIKANEKDPTVIYPMLNKNLAQFVDKSGSRSDADLAIKESGNANAKTQIQPALLHMVQKIIGRERIEIARPQAFATPDEQNYPKHSGSFPTSQDERAYSIDKMPPQEAKQLYQDMRTKALAGNSEGIKFLKSLATAKKTGVVSGLGQ